MQINGSTEIYGIIGNPVAHSLSPIMHNSAFEALGLNKVYVAFPATNAAKALAGCRALGVRGLSVTIPHKETVLDHIDSIDPIAEKIGAVNTLVFAEDKKIHGLNTDWIGANRALASKLDLQGKRILLLGAGGSAKAIGFGLLEDGAQVILASRTESRVKTLAETLACDWIHLDKIDTVQADCLVNATSVGMSPLENASLVPADSLGSFPVVMDIVYSPLETRLLREAKSAGCEVIDGLSMLLYQGVAQFETWTGEDAPVEVMRAALMKVIA
ncbi:MAG: shikimate dehydrogenase [Desulfobacterales bacterium SG8_35_2]|jgi:shikimate dehydrogenase|nr:MAG: shikimate dehydrogenase [Desulfobacterales bacterium SG8_35_2]